ncbi:hypothetical protein PTSG_00578 [Salpingoeca rosetta]|uniref:Uncharacterized protein n=1 Tax=Salpingoeca rosetta (strain ATCC 50818 / BSB-021) TaxID=946362 RepID=F2TWV8_SALR5|nr:uncharacterized protein PTSG_00578 [Salpingoeca rosetta]EGD72554.1 hypothetical protein PTSG_00578 [Salpingoeca rosetta]|eukprot:XP_004999123.1 hypothetical protein PTSG_00578 [Salpingoeca rosetta]
MTQTQQQQPPQHGQQQHHGRDEDVDVLEETPPAWQRFAPAVGLLAVGVGSFFLAFRRSMRQAKALNRDLLDAAKATGEIQEDPADLARKALAYATGMVAALGVTTVAVTSVALDVQSVPEFTDKMKTHTRGFSAAASQYVQAVTDKYMTKREPSEEDIELLKQLGYPSAKQDEALHAGDIATASHVSTSPPQ